MTLSQPNPQKKDLKNAITYRRMWLDFCLGQHSPEMRGVVIDLGGKREKKRGSFRPPEENAKAWWYVNLEMSTHPNIFGDVTATPLSGECADVIICTEVLEHLENPGKCTDEIFRILRPGGRAYISVPFMYPIHADPYDFQRFTADGLRRLFRDFVSIEITPMGGYLGTLGMLLQIGIPGITGQGLHKKILRRSLSQLAKNLCSLDLSRSDRENLIWQKFTTGYFLKVVK
jgi:SAM-dependent methyltransferase